jgi:predicted Zn-ribbon and HTH transcriptional regulator
LREFGYIKREKVTLAPIPTAQEQARTDRENEAMTDRIHWLHRRSNWQRGWEPIEEFLVSMGKTGIVVPVRCKACGDPVKDDTRCENCIKEDGL